MIRKEETHTVTVTGVSRQQIWEVWQDVNLWHTWDLDIEWARLEAPFVTGSRFELKPRSGPKVQIELQSVDEGHSFTDFCRFPLAKMYSIHSLRGEGAGLIVAHTVRVEGPLAYLWWQLVARHVAAGMPQQSEQMIARARGLHAQEPVPSPKKA